MSEKSNAMRVLKGIWRGLDGIRKVLHLVLVVGVFLLLLALVTPTQPVVPTSAALILAPEGTLVEQVSGDPFERAVAAAQGAIVSETRLKDLMDAVRMARDDDRIRALVLELDYFAGAGLSKLQELAGEVQRFKDSGKPVIAMGSGFDENQYYLAAQADQVYMHPMGLVLIDGYSRYLPYYKSALDKLYIDYKTWTVGEYKSFVEPITRDDMSAADREASEAFLGGLWDAYQNDIVAARGLPADALQHYADDFAALLQAADGDTAELALDYGLVDELLTQDAMRARVRAIVGADHDNRDDFTALDQDDYLAAQRFGEISLDGADRVGVIVASGPILDGVQPPGTVGGDSTAMLIRDATLDTGVKALVLRVDSPGGSAFASEIIRRELEVFQETGRPVVASMGSVAASGGYWISMGADQIWASPTTLTGSIGVGATLPTVPRLLDKLGVHIDGVGTTKLAGQYDLTRGIGEDISEMIGASVRHTYDEFVSRVAASRNRSVEEIDAVARGRVWVGSDAAERGLVDKLGNLDDAIVAAAGLAGLEPDRYEVEYFEPQLQLYEQLLLQFASAAAPLRAALGVEQRFPAALRRLLDAASDPLDFIEQLNDPRGIYAYCFCDVR
jgi:protease IV